MVTSSDSAPASTSSRPIPQIDILFLGSPRVGKATFLSRIPSVVPPSVAKRETSLQSRPQQQLPPSTNGSGPQLSSSSATTLLPPLDADTRPPPYASTTSLPSYQQTSQAPSHDAPIKANPLTGPLSFSVSLFARPYSITIHPSTSQIFIDAFPPSPRFAILAFAINDKASLWNAKNYWNIKLKEHYPDEETMRVMLLGLKRDARTDKKVPRRNWEGDGSCLGERVSGDEGQGMNTKSGRGARETANVPKSALGQTGGADWEYDCVMPEEGLQVAREIRADRYAECSALTGELMYEVVEDITRTAAKTTVEEGRENSGSENCTIM